MTRHCGSCAHWEPRNGEAEPHMHYGHELRKCLFFSPNRVGQWPHRKSHLAEVVAVVVRNGDSPGDLMTSAAFGCVEWLQRT